ncbi:MAG: YraN family protein [Terriglobia bacterium]|jgi:putative endonuclease
MSLLARLIYRALVWKERQRASRAASVQSTPRGESESLDLGARGETLAYWYLRQAGYTVVARNWRARSGGGELDLVGWEGPTLAFVEVKTRTSQVAGPPEEAVTPNKQRRVIKGAKEYLRQLKRKPLSCRFDVVSVSLHPAAGLEVRLIKDAFKA